ncbi:hypothetical protein RDI58_003923 [Solanum bulbocastanum]|uniref:Uncharacterized protein n=1 Tax=Solanum bulbocastanum TaxID=147425 RepID=A0AAN8U5L8_SOLBU
MLQHQEQPQAGGPAQEAAAEPVETGAKPGRANQGTQTVEQQPVIHSVPYPYQLDEVIGGGFRSVYPAEAPSQILLYSPYRDHRKHVPFLHRQDYRRCSQSNHGHSLPCKREPKPKEA